MYVCIYIYIERERERKKSRNGGYYTIDSSGPVKRVGMGDDTVGKPRRAQIYQFVFEFKL